jgi:hypothetical protein
MEHGMNILLASNLTVTVITAITELVLFIIVGRRIFDCCCGKCVKRCKKCAEKRKKKKQGQRARKLEIQIPDDDDTDYGNVKQKPDSVTEESQRIEKPKLEINLKADGDSESFDEDLNDRQDSEGV